jgi:hypothetical protein
MGAGKKAVGGGLGMIVIAVAMYFLGVDPATIMNMLGQGGTTTESTGTPEPRPAEENRLADFISVVLADTEDTWNVLFKQMGGQYQEPKLVLFTDAVNSACGFAQAAVGPFYCSADQKVYIDLGFYRDLKERFESPGDFAQAYVIAHEVGHHVQNLLGILGKVHEARQQMNEVQANQLTVKLELQADCFAGLWAYHANRARKVVEQGDVEEALNAASNIGDDRLQMKSQGRVVPDAFTHGTAAQRSRWFKVGFQNGQVNACDTFQARNL